MQEMYPASAGKYNERDHGAGETAHMRALQSLYERFTEPDDMLPPALAALYGGSLKIPERTDGHRPYLLANFVSTLDGVVSFELPNESGGGPISGESEEDHMVMGLLRARTDAIIFGAGSLRSDSGHVRTPQFIFPALAEEFAAYRARLGTTELPLNVVVSGSGNVDLREPTFSTPGLQVIIATTEAGATLLAGETLPLGVEVRAIAHEVFSTAEGSRSAISMSALLSVLRSDYGVRVALTEGGPRLLASFVAAGLLDELFLTIAPQLAGRTDASPRLTLLEGLAFAPAMAPWATLLSLKRAGSHLLARYRFE